MVIETETQTITMITKAKKMNQITGIPIITIDTTDIAEPTVSCFSTKGITEQTTATKITTRTPITTKAIFRLLKTSMR